MSDQYEIIIFRGKRLDRMTAQAILQMEDKLGYQLTVIQGSYNGGGVSASAGTHDGGGAVDLAPYDWKNKVRVGREIGFAMWHRSPSEGPWPEHVHGILQGNARVSRGAANQIALYRMGRNGLVSNLHDTFWRPERPITYSYVKDKTVGISLSSLRIDFIHALGGGTNKSRFRGKVVQRLLNRKVNANLRVDGVIGMATVRAWQRWEAKTGIDGRPGVPDSASLKRLFQWTIYFVKK